MVSERFLAIIIAVGTALVSCHGSECIDTSRDQNTKWREADVVEQLGHDFYQSLALGPFDANDPEKRFASVYGQALYQYIISKAPCEAEKVKEAVSKTRMQLQKPADVLAGPLRSAVSLMYTFAEPPLTDVQQACPPDVCEDSCQKNLARIQAEKIKSCPGYKYTIAAYNLVVKYVTSCGLLNLLEDMVVAANNATDKNALNFFYSTTLVKYPEAIQMCPKIFEFIKSIPPSQICTMFSFL